MAEEKVQRWLLAGKDYVDPRAANNILESYPKSNGIKQKTF